MGWSLLACNNSLHYIDKSMHTQCLGMKFTNPKKNLGVRSIGDCFVDDTEVGVNVQDEIIEDELHRNASAMDKKHTYFWHVNGGRIAVDKCSWYHLKFKFKNGVPIPVETSEVLITKPSYQDEKILVPKNIV